MSQTVTASRGARVQAAVVRVRETFVEQRYGLPARQHYREAASPPLCQLLSTPHNPKGGWVPFDLFIEANVLADRLFGKGDYRLAWEMGRFAASHNLGVWKGLFMRHVTPVMVLGVAAGLWSHHYDGGRLASRASGSSGMSVSIVDFPQPHRAHCLAIGGWIQGTLELGPRKSISVTETACRTEGAAICEFRIAWTN